MNKKISVIKCIVICLFSISTIASVSAQNKGVTLTGKDQLQFYYDEENQTYSFRYDGLRGKTLDVVNRFMEKNKLTEKEYIDLNIAKCKHPSLRTIPLMHISGGSTIVKTDVGTVRLIYASKKRIDKFNGINELQIYVYLLSMTPDGKYIDSLFSGELLSIDLSDRDNELRRDGGVFVRDNQIIIIEQESDGECFGEFEIPYILTKDLKFKKVLQ